MTMTEAAEFLELFRKLADEDKQRVIDKAKKLLAEQEAANG